MKMSGASVHAAGVLISSGKAEALDAIVKKLSERHRQGEQGEAIDR